MTERLEATYAFYNAEVQLFRAGPLQFFRMMRTTLRNQLAAKDGFGPYRLKIRRGDGNVSPHVLVMWEDF